MTRARVQGEGAHDIHPSSFGNFVSVVNVFPACEASCGSTETLCEATNMCWSSTRDHCAYCLGGSNDECACWDGDQFVVDGTACSVALSGDVERPGTCQAGRCKPRQ